MTDTAEAGGSLYPRIFASAEVGRIFSDRLLLQAMLDFEAALALAEAEVGVIPQQAAEAIAGVCDAGLIDLAAVGEEAALAGNLAIPLVKALIAEAPAEARGYVHWGATSQDAIDTAFMLLARRALGAIRGDMRGAVGALIGLIHDDRDTLMPGRTLMQQALPISFAFKAAGWLSALLGASGRLRRIETQSLALQFGGAAGTLAALGDNGLKIRRALAGRLGLPEPEMTWHADRGRIADIAFGLAALSGACSKIATDILLLTQSEVAEAFEPAAPGKGGSSTMPHKRNPVGATAIRANHRRIAGLTATIVFAMEGEHERAAGSWAAEWETMRDLFRLTAGSLERLHDILAGLEVDPERMRRNLDASLGLPLAESLTMALSASLGRNTAHRLVETAAKRALAEGRPLSEVAQEDQAFARLSPGELRRALDPENYLGSADQMIDAVLAGAQREMETG
jgi:3-carboxy-cis,cis-muconate cycloisomerase